MPDVDFIGRNFYHDEEYKDTIPFDKKLNRGVFVGSTTGSLSEGGLITMEALNKNMVPRINSALFFQKCADVDFSLPNIVQCDSLETKGAIFGMGLGQGTKDWKSQFKNKFLISMDGNGATCSRVAIALRSNCVLLKYASDNTLYYFSGLIPWLNYIPIHNDEDVLKVIGIEKQTPGDLYFISQEANEFYKNVLDHENIIRYTGMIVSGYNRLLSEP